jgi:hypothetical protein
MCKVQWSHHTEKEATWERGRIEGGVSKFHFRSVQNLKDEIHFKGGRFVTP